MAITLNGTTGITTPDVDSTDLTATGNFTSRGIDDNATSTAMTLDASGNLLVSKTSSDTNTVGVELGATGYGAFCRDANKVAIFNRKTNDGTILDIKRDGTTVGSIGTQGGYFKTNAATQDYYITLNNGVDNAGNEMWVQGNINPWINGYYNIGASSYRWKDLYLSGGVFLGGVGSANKLDDYEEGTWTPTLGRSSVNPTTTYSRQSGYYIKVGAMVTLFFNMQFGTVSNVGSGTLRINGIPFNTSSDTNMRAAGTFGYNDAIVSTGVENIRIQSTDGANHLLIIAQVLDSTEANNLFSADPTSAKYLQGSITYKTDS